ncbi:tetratricopeptide repeat protein [Deinococcus sp. RIT780]|uniref:tetratricopeptide repeat protein n=1 Tax=Deinococcus sp. RIT780 TaxID=2870472 RepID=UPI001C899072|nr:tetratricopeptide repeat protein [Deinococcus sp. RIT780]MBX8466718.1 tetratricopeptide repeat protein [Deinococcus sp. RIT780]
MTAPPELLTLGSLRAAQVPFRREKPLLLLAYLSLRGPQERRAVARLFWPDATDPMNSLSVALGQLRRASSTLVHATDTQVSTALICDVSALLRACADTDLSGAQTLYRGAFAAGLPDADLSDELAGWVTVTREHCASTYRDLLLSQARQAAETDALRAGEWAAQAYAVAGAAPPAPPLFRELHALLRAAGHPDAPLLERDAASLNVTLSAPAPPLPGRQAELQQLTLLPAGETLWVRGPAGIGKSALLRAVPAGTLLRARTGQPYATLLGLPDLPHPPPADGPGWARHLGARPGPLLIDDWETCDPESRRALLGLSATRSGPPLILASREGPPTLLPQLILRPLPAGSPEERAETGGLPALRPAGRSGLSLADAYAALLAPHAPRARQLLACLGVQDNPDLRATQAALEFGGDDMAAALERLRQAYLLDGTRPAAPEALRAWLDTQPSLETEVLTLLAAQLPPADALGHYLRAHALTGSSDFPGFQAALAGRARALLAADRHVEAYELLRPHARSPGTRLLLARALDAMGHHREALGILGDLPDTPLVQVYRGRAVWRLGDREQATLLANAGLNGDMEARAQAFNLLSSLALAAQEYAQAHDGAQRSAGLFLLLGDDLMRLKMTCVQAVAAQHLGLDVRALVREMLEAPLDHLPPQMLLNIGWVLEEQGQLDEALGYARQAAASAERTHDLSVAATAWNNVGVLNHKQGHPEPAAAAYRQAIGIARQSGEVRVLAMALGNLAELQESLPLIDEALNILEGAGHDDLASYFRQQQAAFRGRSGET